jgi:Rhodopirellula transposase DDE domain
LTIRGAEDQSGGGRKSLTQTNPGLLDDLNALVEPDAQGNPMSPLRWTCKSLRRLAAELEKLGHKVSHTVADNQDRDAQFRVVNDAVKAAMAENQPAISVDTKKKELVGDFKNAGPEWRRQGDPEEVGVHDFLIKDLGRAVPYGISDLAANAGWANVGVDNDMASFAVQTIRRWWQEVGRIRYPLARRLVITADGGGSNGSHVRLWKLELQRLANELGLSIEVHHLPPGTSKWNKIEHRLFSFITQSWCAKPLLSYRVIVELIGATTTQTLTVRRELDTKAYPKGIVSDEQMKGPQYPARALPRRMELLDLAINSIDQSG